MAIYVDPSKAVMTPKEYSKYSGIPEKTVIDKINKGVLPRYYPEGHKAGDKCAIWVNVLAIAKEADKQAEVVDWSQRYREGKAHAE